MARRSRLALAIMVLSAALVFALAGAVFSSASVVAGGKVVSAKLTPKASCTTAQANTVKLVCRFSPASKRATFLLSIKKSGKWVKVRSVTKTGKIKAYTTTVKKLFGSKAVKAGQYQVKVSADVNSLTRKFTVSAATPSESSSGDSSGDTSTTSGRTRGGGGDCGEDCEDGSGDEDPGDEDPGGGTTPEPGVFTKTFPTSGQSLGSGITGVGLDWSSINDVLAYEYCVDTINNNTCDGSWTSTGTDSYTTIHNLVKGTAYYWQVLGRTSAGTEYADSGTWSRSTSLPDSAPARTRST